MANMRRSLCFDSYQASCSLNYSFICTNIAELEAKLSIEMKAYVSQEISKVWAELNNLRARLGSAVTTDVHERELKLLEDKITVGINMCISRISSYSIP